VFAWVLAAACSNGTEHVTGGAAAGGMQLGAGGMQLGAAGTAGRMSGSGGAEAGHPAAQAGNGASTGGSSGVSAGRSGAGGHAGSATVADRGGGAGQSGASGEASAATTGCKRGIAANVAPGPAFSPGVAWWYDWSMTGAGSVEFVPMMWGKDSVSTSVPANADYLLTFNEPNFHAQSNLTPQSAAALWPDVETKAKAAGVPVVSPAMNFCGPASDCNGTDPYQYLKDFFTACSGCEVDYVAVHWYNCDLPSLKDYLEPGGSLEGFEQFGVPIWLTEFSCNGDASAADQEAYMRAAVPYLEANPHVFRYSWFSADPIPNAKLVADDGSPTALGQVYLGLPASCD
jgi:hypothetical protein